MKYFIAFLLKGDAAKYHQMLVRRVGPKFGEMKSLESKNPSHVTLKYPFHTDNIEKIEEAVEIVARKNKKSKITYNKFGNFRKFVCFWRPRFSEQGYSVQKQLIQELRKVKWLKIEERDRIWRPHSTITFAMTPKSFEAINNYLKLVAKQEGKEFIINFDNITILKKPRKYWKIHKSYSLK